MSWTINLSGHTDNSEAEATFVMGLFKDSIIRARAAGHPINSGTAYTNHGSQTVEDVNAVLDAANPVDPEFVAEPEPEPDAKAHK